MSVSFSGALSMYKNWLHNSAYCLESLVSFATEIAVNEYCLVPALPEFPKNLFLFFGENLWSTFNLA